MPTADASSADGDPLLARFQALAGSGSPVGEADVPAFVSSLLKLAVDAGASDVHIEPARERVELCIRLDGVLKPLSTVPRQFGPNMVARLKVLAGLLTYETALPQEGRIRQGADENEFRISTFPTIFGEKVVIRVLHGGGELQRVADLGLPLHIAEQLHAALYRTSGGVIVAGPAGSGKTTTAYACLREIAAQSDAGRSIATLEDPVEVVVEGAMQSQVNAAAGLDMATGLRSLLRQDPEVMLIGEIRDATTAEIALQAALTGQLVITTFHAGSSGEAVHRLIDMGLPGYAVRNAVRLVLCQRLMRRLCGCAREADPSQAARSLGIEVESCRVATGCDACQQTGYRGRVVIAESISLDEPAIREALATSRSAHRLGELLSPGKGNLWSAAIQLVEKGVTSPAEVVRVLGLAASQ